MLRIIFVFMGLLVANSSAAQGWYEPQRGTAERAQLMNALRPYAEYVVGPPVQFVVGDLRVSGNVAFASTTAQRPGGAQINPYQTPAYQRGEFDPQSSTFVSYHALFVRANGGWQVHQYSVDAGDVWWSDPRLCQYFRVVTPEVC